MLQLKTKITCKSPWGVHYDCPIIVIVPSGRQVLGRKEESSVLEEVRVQILSEDALCTLQPKTMLDSREVIENTT